MKSLSRITKLIAQQPRSHTPQAFSSSFYEFSRKFSQLSQETTTLSLIAPKKTFPRLEALGKELGNDQFILARSIQAFELSKRGQSFLNQIHSQNLNKKYSRGGNNGEGYIRVEELVELAGNGYYDDEERKELLEKSKDVQERMRVKVSKPYLNHALNVPKNAKAPNPILKIVMPDIHEIDDLSGEIDPSNQNRYSPLPGLLHKYEMLLAFTSINCSSHCRYCYRLDLFSGVSGKSKADMLVIAAYIKTFNEMIDDAIKNHGRWDEKTGLWVHRETNEPLLHVREILFSGGDPMTLPNATIARYMALMADAGIKTIRIGTKELVFNPSRFDGAFWKMMDLFHETYPEVKLEIVGHYSHPFELVEAEVDEEGDYLYDVRFDYRVRKDFMLALHEINQRRDWIGHHNQFPIIAGINDSSDILRLLLYLNNRMSIVTHNIYACREIPGNSHFRGENDIERQYQLVQQAKVGLSGLENHARLIMSTEYGKMEVIGMRGRSIFLKLNRFAHGHNPEDTVIVVDISKLPQGERFYWLNDEIIEKNLEDQDKKMFQEFDSEDGAFIRKFKETAAEKVFEIPRTSNENNLLKPIQVRKKTVNIEVKTAKGESRLIEIDLADEKHVKKPPSMATVLKERGFIEAACDEKLSCSTCVGEIESSSPLPTLGEDEEDVIDSYISAKRDFNNNDIPSANNIRATCQISLKPGESYRFNRGE